jgi:hypothetical protein
MALTIPNLTPGDVISLDVPPGVGIVQFAGVNARTGVSTIRVVPGVFGAIPPDIERQLTERSVFHAVPHRGTRELTDAERDLPIRAIWPLARLKLLLRAGWIPRYEAVAGDTTFTGDGDTPPRIAIRVQSPLT